MSGIREYAIRPAPPVTNTFSTEFSVIFDKISSVQALVEIQGDSSQLLAVTVHLYFLSSSELFDPIQPVFNNYQHSSPKDKESKVTSSKN